MNGNEYKSISYRVVKQIKVLGTNKHGWTKELNLISWNGGEAKYDIREWNPDHNRCGKGLTFSKAELDALYDGIVDSRVMTARDNIDRENAIQKYKESIG